VSCDYFFDWEWNENLSLLSSFIASFKNTNTLRLDGQDCMLVGKLELFIAAFSSIAEFKLVGSLCLHLNK
jgi:hypothetical protein